MKSFLMFALVLAFIFLVLLLFMADKKKEKFQEEVMMTATIEITSPSFEHGGNIPVKYTCDSANVSPSISWGALPEGTKELVLICDDPDASSGNWVHWVVYGLSPDTTGLPEGVPDTDEIAGGAKQGKNSFRRVGYDGPCPPPGPVHRYFFRLYAVDKPSKLKAGKAKWEVMEAIEDHVLAFGELMGRYGR